jgi:hypothetical protein
MLLRLNPREESGSRGERGGDGGEDGEVERYAEMRYPEERRRPSTA